MKWHGVASHGTGRRAANERRTWLKQMVIASLLLNCGLLRAQTSAPERKVNGNIITSERDPKARIELPESVHYVGADRWVLYGIADCELHAFVEADGQKNVQRLYWVQFEQYIPSKPDLHHTYDSPRHTTIGGMDFYVDTWVWPTGIPSKPGSDRQHIDSLVRAKGYKMPAGMMYVRLVHLLDEPKRKELMIIYGEDLASTGLAAAELGENGKAHDRWASIERGLVERARQRTAIKESAKP